MTVIWFPCGQCHLWAECRREWGTGSNVVTVSGMLVPLLRIAPHCPRLASTPLQALTGFTFWHSKTVKMGGCSPPHLMWQL